MAKFTIKQIPTLFSASLGLAEFKKLEFYCKRANKTQEKLLLSLMKKNKSTVYGKKNNFKDVHSIEDYQKIVPLAYYEDYADYVHSCLRRTDYILGPTEDFLVTVTCHCGSVHSTGYGCNRESN